MDVRRFEFPLDPSLELPKFGIQTKAKRVHQKGFLVSENEAFDSNNV